jgi:hypothetical protein
MVLLEQQIKDMLVEMVLMGHRQLPILGEVVAVLVVPVLLP